MPYILFVGILTITILGMEPVLSMMAITTYFTCNTITCAVILLCLETAVYQRFIQFIWNPRKFNPEKKIAPTQTHSTVTAIETSSSS
jgi:hypothetical protein